MSCNMKPRHLSTKTNMLCEQYHSSFVSVKITCASCGSNRNLGLLHGPECYWEGIIWASSDASTFLLETPLIYTVQLPIILLKAELENTSRYPECQIRCIKLLQKPKEFCQSRWRFWLKYCVFAVACTKNGPMSHKTSTMNTGFFLSSL